MKTYPQFVVYRSFPDIDIAVRQLNDKNKILPSLL
jgi:hypothetical protein